jgi:hypothetical protein
MSNQNEGNEKRKGKMILEGSYFMLIAKYCYNNEIRTDKIGRNCTAL